MGLVSTRWAARKLNLVEFAKHRWRIAVKSVRFGRMHLADNFGEHYYFGQGYAAGKDKAHFEVRNLSGHSRGCGCEPCITTRSVIARHARGSRVER